MSDILPESRANAGDPDIPYALPTARLHEPEFPTQTQIAKRKRTEDETGEPEPKVDLDKISAAEHDRLDKLARGILEQDNTVDKREILDQAMEMYIAAKKSALEEARKEEERIAQEVWEEQKRIAKAKGLPEPPEPTQLPADKRGPTTSTFPDIGVSKDRDQGLVGNAPRTITNREEDEREPPRAEPKY